MMISAEFQSWPRLPTGSPNQLQLPANQLEPDQLHAQIVVDKPFNASEELTEDSIAPMMKTTRDSAEEPSTET